MATRWVGTSEREKPNTLSCLDHPEDGSGQRWVSYTQGQSGCFPWILRSGWGQSTDPSVLFKVLKYFSVWMNDYPLLCHQRIFMTVEARLSSWRRDNAWLYAARQRVPFGGHTNVFSYSHGHRNFFG